MSSAPTSTLRTHRKRLDFSDASEEFGSVFNTLFPEYNWLASQGSSVTEGGPSLFTPERDWDAGRVDQMYGYRPRRYSGGDALPTDRYYTLCDENGADNGTLVNEVRSYWSPISGVFPFISDSTLNDDHGKKARTILPNLGVKNHALLFFINRLNSISEDLFLSDIDSYACSSELLNYMWADISIDNTVVPNVLDLRYPNAQHWFVDYIIREEFEAPTRLDHPTRPGFVHDGSHMFSNPFKDSRPYFTQFISFLTDNSLGGIDFHFSVGQLLRRNGIAGLVFPSARRDCSVKSSNECISNFEGWNFVDYRRAPIITNPKPFGFSRLSYFGRTSEYETRVTVRKNGNSETDWTAHGLSERTGANERKKVQLIVTKIDQKTQITKAIHAKPSSSNYRVADLEISEMKNGGFIGYFKTRDKTTNLDSNDRADGD